VKLLDSKNESIFGIGESSTEIANSQIQELCFLIYVSDSNIWKIFGEYIKRGGCGDRIIKTAHKPEE
ncbi:TPA: hypothetical protein DCZ36_02645, partial [Candidatus Gracilibacteria bacterium]|nr:hypothetical protein [Candidatus Gracilibacteria bacterium]